MDERERLEHQLADSREQRFLLQKLFIAITQLHQSLEAEKVHRTIFEILRDFVGADVSVLVLSGREGRARVVTDQASGAKRIEAFEQKRLLALPNLQRVLATRNSWMHRGLDEDIPETRPADLETWEPLLIYPLIAGRRCVGAFCVFDFVAKKRQLTAIDFQFFTLLSEHAGSAVVSADLYGRAETELAALRGIGEAAMRTLDLRESATAALTQLQAAILADEYRFLRVDPQAETLVLEAALGGAGSAQLGLVIPVDGSFLGGVVRGAPGARHLEARGLTTRHESESFVRGTVLVSQVQTRDGVLGVLMLTRDDGADLFDAHDRNLLHNASGQVAVGIQNAIFHGQLARNRDELAEARQRAERASQFKSEFLASMSHEIRTPMNAIVGFTEILHEDETDSGRRRKLAVVREAAGALLGLINDILDLSKIEAGKLELNEVPFSMARCLEQLHNLFVFRCAEKDLDLRVVADVDFPKALRGDSHRITQVLINLVGNAIKFTERGRISVDARYVDEFAVIRVEDSGIGMTREASARIFEQYEQAEDDTTQKFGGTGLGLSITRNLVDLMGGSIDVESELGDGTAFTVRLPLPELPAHTLPPEDRLPSAPRRSGRRIGYVEDDPAAAALLEELLKRNGFVAIRLELDDDFVDNVVASGIELLVMDLLVEGQNSLTFNDQLKRDPRTVFLPVIVCSVEAEGALKGTFGYFDFVKKPITSRSLMDTLHRAMRLSAGRGRVVALDADPERATEYEHAFGGSGGVEVHASPQDALVALDAGTAPGLVVSRYDSRADSSWNDAVARLHEVCGKRGIPFVTVGSTGPDGPAAGHLDAIGQTLDSLIEPMARRIANAERVGEEMVQRWLDSQGIPKLRLLLLDNIRNRLFTEIGKLEAAIFGGDAEGVRRFAHAIKGWSGTFKMDEIYEVVARIDDLARSEQFDLAECRWDAVELGAILARIPRKYLMDMPDERPDPLSPEPVIGLGLHVLVVDDNDINRDLVGTLLGRQGVTFDEAASGAEAIEQMRESEYDVVLMDLEMPVMNGWQAIDVIRADPSLADSHVIALTAHALVGIEERCLEAGFSGYLPKPIDRLELYARLADRARERDASSD